MEERVYDLKVHNIECLTHLPGDTTDDDNRVRQIEVLDDDLQSIEDMEYYEKREKEERDDPVRSSGRNVLATVKIRS
eukprot:4078870-Amphidinium_carterae.1